MTPLGTRFLACAALALAASCRSAGHLPVAREFAPARDAFGDVQALATLLPETGAAPWRVLVGGGDQMDALLVAREAEAPSVTLVDLSVVDALQRDAVEARALEAALDSEGPLLLDEDGANARVLRGTSRAISLVVLNADRSIGAISPVLVEEDAP